MAKNIFYNEEALMELLQGVKIATKAARTTYGPMGRNAVIEINDKPYATKDGATVVRNIELKDPVQNQGAKLLRQLGESTGENLGDGSTTSIILAEALLAETYKYVTAGVNVESFILGLESGCQSVLKSLNDVALMKKSPTIIKNVAAVAANNDAEVGDLIEKLFSNGFMLPVVYEDSHTASSHLELIKGMELDSGFYSKELVTDKENQTAEYDDCFVLVANQKVDATHEVFELFNKLSEERKPLAVIAKDFTPEFIKTLIINQYNNILNVLPIKLTGSNADELLSDIALVSGTTVVDPKYVASVKNLQINELGVVEKIASTGSKTLITFNPNSNKLLEKTVSILTLQFSNSKNSADREKLTERISRLKGEIARIYVGAASQLEREEKKLRFKNAWSSAQAAIEDGIIAGGGTGFLFAISNLNDVKHSDKDAQKGIIALANTLKVPFCTILLNAGIECPEKIDAVLSKENPGFGFNVVKNEYEDFYNSGIIDPVKFLKAGVQNAVSFVSMFIRTQCAITLQESKTQSDNF